MGLESFQDFLLSNFPFTTFIEVNCIFLVFSLPFVEFLVCFVEFGSLQFIEFTKSFVVYSLRCL